jgi:hypothetical protein
MGTQGRLRLAAYTVTRKQSGHEGGEHSWYGETLAWARIEGCDSPLTL